MRQAIRAMVVGFVALGALTGVGVTAASANTWTQGHYATPQNCDTDGRAGIGQGRWETFQCIPFQFQGETLWKLEVIETYP